MTADHNGKLKLSFGNWIGLFTLSAVIVASQVGFAIKIGADVAGIAAGERANADKIVVNRENIRENRSDIKVLGRSK